MLIQANAVRDPERFGTLALLMNYKTCKFLGNAPYENTKPITHGLSTGKNGTFSTDVYPQCTDGSTGIVFHYFSRDNYKVVEASPSE